MALLPEGFALPPLPYLLGLAVAAGAVAAGLRRVAPPVGEREVLGLAPWIAAGAGLHVLFALDALPPAVAPLAGTPAVYITAGVAAGVAWLGLAAAGVDRVPAGLAAIGGLAFLGVAAATVASGRAAGTLAPLPSAAALVAAVPLAAVTWLALRRAYPAAAVTGRVGLLTVFGHALDGVSTAVGVGLLGFGERTPLSRLLLDLGARLPVGAAGGWLFVAVKLALAAAVVALFAEFVEAEPTRGRLLLGLVAAVGLGPGVHNLLLFAAAGASSF